MSLMTAVRRVNIPHQMIFGRKFHIINYFFSTFITSVCAFFAVPLLIRVMKIEEFGRWSFLEPLFLLFSQTAILGLNYGVIKNISFDKLLPSYTFRSLLITAQPVMILTSLVGFLTLSYSGFTLNISLWFSLFVYSEAVLMLLLATFRAANNSFGFASISALRALVILIVLLIAVFVGSVEVNTAEDMIKWSFLASLCSVFLGLFLVRDMNGTGHARLCNMELYKDSLKYGLPLFITGLFTLVILYGERYILASYLDYSALAQYVIYVKIAAIINPILITPFNIWWPTERFNRLKDTDGGVSFFRNTSVVFLAILLLCGGSLWLFSPVVLSWFAPGIPSRMDIQLLLIASVIFMGMAAPLNIGMLNPGRTHWNIYAVLIAAVIHISCCFLIIPWLGIYGAALATAISYFFYTFIMNLLSQRFYAVPFAYVKMLLLILISPLLLLGIHEFASTGSIPVKTAIFLAASFSIFLPLLAANIRQVYAKR